MSPRRIPIVLLTGFLGAGKTTWLNRLLREPGFASTAVVINELGEVGIDHQLVRHASDQVTVLENGCLCCVMNGELIDTLRELYLKRVKDEIPEFERVLIETTGLADPSPVVGMLSRDAFLDTYYRFDGVLTLVDVVNGMATLDTHFEAVKQVAMADRVALTKGDLMEDADTVDALIARIKQINPGIEVADARCVAPGALIGGVQRRPGIGSDARRWLAAERFAAVKGIGGVAPPPTTGGLHDGRVQSFCVVFDEPVQRDNLRAALEMLCAFRGEHLLRIKGIVNAIGHEQPLVVHAVQHTLYPIETLDAWPDDDRRTRLVFIERDLDAEFIRLTLQNFVQAGNGIFTS
ncbi:MAG: GTP-binding protein [Rhodocyclaceae bacterium]|nr:GTP-binding protein [Rhodocyclaceae bacterium]